MSQRPWYPDAATIDAVITWLREEVPASPPGSWHRPPGLGDVRCTHIEDGWVHLTFLDWPLPAARAVADQLLHPDALLVSMPGTFMNTNAPAFEGFGWDEDPPAAVLARYNAPSAPPGPTAPAPPHAARPVPASSSALAAAID